MKKLIVPAAALCAAAGIAMASTGAAAHANAPTRATPSSATLHVTKECSTYLGLADQHCTITSSNLAEIPAGARIVYLEAAQGTVLNSDVVLVVGRRNYALGHVRVDLATGTGRVRLAGGAGPFTSFRASAKVSPLGGANFAWNGRYTFGDDDD